FIGTHAVRAMGEGPPTRQAVQLAQLVFHRAAGYRLEVTLGTIIRFQFGGKQAIEAVARSRAAFVAGIILVLLTGIARTYDQNWLMESPLWLIGPLLFSILSGTVLFEILFLGFIKRRLASPENGSTFANWRCFMGLFWTTAPV